MTVLAEKYEELEFDQAPRRVQLRLVDPIPSSGMKVGAPGRRRVSAPARVSRSTRVRSCEVQRPPAQWRLTERGVRLVTVAFGLLLASAVGVIVFEFLSVSNAPLG